MKEDLLITATSYLIAVEQSPRLVILTFAQTGHCYGKYASEVGRRIFGFARGNIAEWRPTKAKSTMRFWRCYG
jgi:hypothetical protein